MSSIKVARLLEESGEELKLSLVAGRAGLERRITHDRVQKHGLVLAGFFKHIHPERIEVFGNTELEYFGTLPPARQDEIAEGFFSQTLACLVVTKGLPVPACMVEAAERHGCPLMVTTLLSSTFIVKVQDVLAEALTAQTSVHGALLDVFGVGILLLGKSGIGKSEAALDLVMRGHRLVADDIVEIKRKKLDSVYGSGSAIIKHHMEIRGLGIINIKDLFGIASIRERKKIEMVVELVEWDPGMEYDRLGIEDRHHTILDVEIPKLTVPVRPGRNMATIIEVAARNQLLKFQGYHSAREFQAQLNREIAQVRPSRGLGDEVE
ncbi:HPr(Ser) kinase/phosphatase [Vulgatibacter incomptus]|uniref:HPr kinase/phosphorylase n=1 Tax=Vulgatibacter incomptus TaxID=1391653 RepID=A0A0K1PFE4_9BACT|nr:HPr(Ser) kinase/phosphatase [Vulgatibacter incomptus]AKU92230.1 HPr kinase/phosphorylase [Vulgatibacter incomptus]